MIDDTQSPSCSHSSAGSHAGLRALAQGDCEIYAERFRVAGLLVQQPACGILQVRHKQPRIELKRILISVGIHGDETAPIDMLAQLIDQLSLTPGALAVDLMLVVGNLPAIAQGRRFIEADLNRLFCQARGALASTQEAGRADQIMQATLEFFTDSATPQTERWHLDLHTTIRPSHIATFAIIPIIVGVPRSEGTDDLTQWLGHAKIGAVVFNPTNAATFSSFNTNQYAARSATLELCRGGVLGHNDMSLLEPVKTALRTLLCESAFARVLLANPPVQFRVTQQIIKLSDSFRMMLDDTTFNFTCMPKGAVIARDGATTYSVQEDQECIVFPNPNVLVGQRAGLMVVDLIIDKNKGSMA